MFQRSNCAVKLPVSKLTQYLQPFFFLFFYLCNVKIYKNNRRKDFKLSKMVHPGNLAVPLVSVYMGKFSFASVYMGEIFTPVVHINAQEFLNSTTHRDLTNRAVLPSGPARLQYKHPLSQTENRWLKQNLTPNLVSCCMHTTPLPNTLSEFLSGSQGYIFFHNSPPPPGVGEKNRRALGLGRKIKEE